jgi:hypothetical protein
MMLQLRRMTGMPSSVASQPTGGMASANANMDDQVDKIAWPHFIAGSATS